MGKGREDVGQSEHCTYAAQMCSSRYDCNNALNMAVHGVFRSVSSGRDRSASLVDNEDAAGREAELHKCLSHLFAAEYLSREGYADLSLDSGGGRLLPDPVEDALERVLALPGGDNGISGGKADLKARLLLCRCGRGGGRIARGRLWA